MLKQRDDFCVCCGEYVPEGSMVCKNCLESANQTASQNEHLQSLFRGQKSSNLISHKTKTNGFWERYGLSRGR